MVASFQDTVCCIILGPWREDVVGGCRVGVQSRGKAEIFPSPSRAIEVIAVSDLRVRLSPGDKYKIPRIAGHLVQPLFVRKQATGSSVTGLRFHSLRARPVHCIPPQLCSMGGALAVFKHQASS